VSWSDAGGDWEALELPDGRRVAVTCLRRIPTAEEAAAEQAAAAERTNDTNRRQTLREIRARIKAGTETAADRSRAIKILIGLALAEKPEANE
jgi:hypothetical protein